MEAALLQFAPFIAIGLIFYFMIIRPQQQQRKRHQEMVDNLRRGDEVVTSSGLIGKIVRVQDQELSLELAEGVRVRVLKQTVAEVRNRTEPANDTSDKTDKIVEKN
ncbi:preprotein translocase subunit YajC [Woodsholea maritima]|uniref:preprotein translocase subunit YajC n=1 Tax=Woodsholea maritima TaxID=240237 RepID=UPI0003697C6D|nr:preprotein translocase subunit YajC [Woodsholea maritima]